MRQSKWPKPAIWIRRTQVTGGTSVTCCWKPGDRSGAEKQLRLALQRKPSSPETNLSLARLLIKQDRRGEAAQYYRTSLRLKPDQVEARRELGELYSVGGDFAAAAAEFRRAIALDPKNARLRQDLGNSLLRAGDLTKAEPELRRAIQIEPSLGTAHRDLGLVLRAMGDQEGALREFRGAAELTPTDSSIHYMLSQILRKLGKAQEAQQESDAAEHLARTEKDASLAVAYSNQGLFLIQQSKGEEGLATLREARRMAPDNLGIQFDYAVGLRRLHRYEDSINQLQQILQRQPDLPGAHYQLGYAYFREGRLDEAVASFAEAARLIHRLEPANKLYERSLECVRRRLSACTVEP